MRKRTLSTILLSPVLLIVLVYAILISPLGGPTIRLAATSFVDNLAIEKIQGGIADGLTISALSYEDETWHANINNLFVDITWRCLFEPRLCVNDVVLNQATIVQKREPAETDNTTSTAFALPFPIELEHADIRDFTLELLAQKIRVGTLQVDNVEANTRIDIAKLTLSSLAITIEPGEKKPTAQPTSTSTLPSSYSLSYTVPELPTIESPIPISLETFELKDVQFNQGETHYVLNTVSFENFVFDRSDIAMEALLVAHQQGTLTGSLDAKLASPYPLTIDVDASGEINGDQQSVTAKATGDLSDLSANIAVTGEINGNIALKTNILDEKLPISFDANWQEQALPLVAEGKLHAGQVSLNGTMGDYVLRGEGAATLPDAGRIPVALNVILKENNISVTEGSIEALEGRLSNTGTLYLDESIYWEGSTTLTDVSASLFDSRAPDALNGNLTSVVQYDKNGLHMSLKDLDISGILQGKPLSVKGSAVYSGPSDLVVTTLKVQQADNAIDINAQVLNKRYVNADVGINVKQVETLYSDISGEVKSTIKVTGPWNDPSTSGDVHLNNIAISPNISADAAQQGLINGDITFEGTYSNHDVTVAINVPKHNVNAQFAGSWNNNAWQGRIKESSLKIANMNWLLESGFDVQFTTTPMSAAIGTHCWVSRNEGQLCIDTLDVENNNAQWKLAANLLPVGLWAHELFPEIVASSVPATLTAASQGTYSANGDIDAQFNASLSPATWQLGKTRPIDITINSIETEGSMKQGKLSARSIIQSDDLGNAELTVSVHPFEEEIPLDGMLVINNIDVAPLKPLSPAIRTLTGNLNGNVRLKGAVTSPVLSGELNVANGAIDIQDTPVSLKDWQQSIILDGQTADFTGTFILGGGKGELTGGINWSDTPSVDFSLIGDKFEVKQPNMVFRISPDIDVNATTERVDISGDINIPWARIEIESLPESAVSPSKDVYLRGEPDREEPLDIVHASVMVNIDKKKTGDVKLEAFGLNANLHGGIRVNTQPALVGYGDLQILDGRYSAYGQQLVIQTGEVQFNGPIDQPLLLIEAIRDPDKTDDSVIAGIRIDGSADAPSINLFSEPAMDQQNVLSYLLTGQGPDAETQDPNYGAILLGFGLSNTKSLTGQVGKSLGIEDFRLGTNEDRLSVTGQINDRLSVEYNVDVGLSNNDANSTLRRRQQPPDLALRYQLLPRLFLEAVQTTIDDQSQFALDLYYEFFSGEAKEPSDDANIDE